MNENTFNQIQRADPLVESVLQNISEAIVIGRLQPGNKLVETQLAEQLGVSRGPVREAIRRLEQMGLVEKIPYRGTFVSQLTNFDIEELYSVREPLEGMAARLLAQRQDTVALDSLNAIIKGMSQAAETSDKSKIVTLDADFHDSLISLCNHKLLNEIWAPVSIRMHRFLLLKNKNRYENDLRIVVHLHTPIVDAIAAGDGTEAEMAARKHIIGAIQHLKEQVSVELEGFAFNGRLG